MRLGFGGWHVTGETSEVIRFRYPWRTNWVRKLHASDSARVVLSRAGIAHIVLGVQPQSSEEKKQRYPQKPILFLAAAILGMAGFLLWPSPTAPQEVQIETVADPCAQLASQATQLTTEWVKSNQVTNVEITETGVLQLGGVKSSLITIRCQNNEMTFRSTWVKDKMGWQLKKMSQLEN
jgi:hypothetical protein